mmetsp:Transcript_29859/g.41022  ORF Transcript_29859/g.41022 Transcript_29859/m.41022 type:complete len:80 (-) Transcript_29859:133-372(-)
MSALFDFPSLLIVILLFICCTTFTKSLYPSLFEQINNTDINKRGGLMGLCWKASRIGERLSPYVCLACVLMAFYLLIIK